MLEGGRQASCSSFCVWRDEYESTRVRVHGSFDSARDGEAGVEDTVRVEPANSGCMRRDGVQQPTGSGSTHIKLPGAAHAVTGLTGLRGVVFAYCMRRCGQMNFHHTAALDSRG